MTLVPQLECYSKYATALQDPTLAPELQKYMTSLFPVSWRYFFFFEE